MKGLTASIKVGILITLMVAGSYSVWKMIGQSPSGEDGNAVWAKFKDAQGLPKGSRVVVAGLPVGEISDLGIEGRYAKVTMRIRKDMQIWDNAVVFKKASSLLGDFYLEIDPGTPESFNAEGTPKTHQPIAKGAEITNVVEAASVDEVVRKVEQTMPKVDNAIVTIRDLAQDLRDVVKGPLRSMAVRLDRLIQDEAGTVGSILQRADSTMARIDQIAADIRVATRSGGKVDSFLDNLDEASAEAKDLVIAARKEVEETGAVVRDKVNSIDSIIDHSDNIVRKVDENEGTLGRLVNDSTLADNLEDITENAKGFFGTLFGMQTYVGLRSEYNVVATNARHYVSIELRTRPDKYYLVELVQSPRGANPTSTLSWDRSLGQWRQDVVVEDGLRFTFQFAKRIEWLTLRYGIKESSGGIGADMHWFDDSLRVSVDAFDAAFDALPRLKLTAAYELWGFLYVLAGVDDVLNGHETFDIDAIGDSQPTEFRSLHFGRDVFVGAMLRFNDLDLASLLTVGGAALVGLTE